MNNRILQTTVSGIPLISQPECRICMFTLLLRPLDMALQVGFPKQRLTVWRPLQRYGTPECLKQTDERLLSITSNQTSELRAATLQTETHLPEARS